MKDSRFSVIAARTVPILVALVLLNPGCGRKHDIISNCISKDSPTITVSLNKSEDISTPTAGIKAIINVQGGRAGIAKVIYSISGSTRTTDTLYYSSGPMILSESIVLLDDIELAKDSSLTLQIIAIDEDGLISNFEHIFYPVDVQAPNISISYDNSHSYAPNDTVMVHVTASDNTALYYIALSTAGAFAWNDTLRFNMPYPATIDTVIPVPIPLTTYLNFEFWITVEAVDVNFNTSSISPDESIQIVFEDGPLVEVHPVGGSKWVSRGDSLRFWVVGYNDIPLDCLGYSLTFGNVNWFYLIKSRDSICGDFGVIDSAYFACPVPDTINCDNYLYIQPFCLDYMDRRTIGSDTFVVEDHILISQATTFETFWPDLYGRITVDDRRNLVYSSSPYQKFIRVYSQLSRQFLRPIELPYEILWTCLSPDSNFILATHTEEKSISIINIDAAIPYIDTVITVPARPRGIVTLSDGTALMTTLSTSDNSEGPLLRMNLSNYCFDTIDLGSAHGERIISSGNSEYALIFSHSPERRLFMYQANMGIIATTETEGNQPVTSNYDGSRFLVFQYETLITRIYDQNLSLIGTVPHSTCYYSNAEAGTFSRDGRNLYISDNNGLGHINAEAWTIEGFYALWPGMEVSAFTSFATNRADDRLFICAQMAPWNRFVFWDIPIDPR